MLSAAMPTSSMPSYYQEVADPSYRPRNIQYPVKVETTPDKLEISTQPAQVQVDSAATYRDMNLYIHPDEFRGYIQGIRQQAYTANLDTLVNEGHYLAAIDKGNNVAQLAVMQSNSSTLPRVDIKPKALPAITYQPAQVKINYTPGDVTMVPAGQGHGLNIMV